MTLSNEMEENLIDTISTFILERDDDAPFRLEAQESNLRDKQCTQPRYGAWIDRCDYPFLMETLMLDHAVFSDEFPGVKFPAKERAELALTLEEHCEQCVRCHLKRGYDLEWQARVDEALTENRDVIGKTKVHAVGEK